MDNDFELCRTMVRLTACAGDVLDEDLHGLFRFRAAGADARDAGRATHPER